MLTIKKKSKATRQTQDQQIATLTNKVGTIFAVYKKNILIAASVIVALLVIVGGYSLMKSADESKASPLLAVAYAYYGQSDASTPDYGKALELFRGVKKKYPGTMSAAIAQYYAGNCLAALGRQDEALKEYQLFVDAYSDKKYLLGLVYQRMGYIYNAQGRQNEAIKAFEQSEAIGGPGVSTIELARLYEISGNLPESQKKYKLAEEKLSGTTWGMEAMGKLQMIKNPMQPAAEGAGK